MTQLSNDCFSVGEGLARLDDLIQLIKSSINPIQIHETVALTKAQGRVLAEDLHAVRNVPFHNNSAVDGFGVRFTDLNQNTATQLAVAGRVSAGENPNFQLPSQEACRIFTGAIVPRGVDTIFMQEDVGFVEEAETATFPNGLSMGSNLRSAGEDVKRGDLLLSKGQVLRPQDVGMLASQGITHISCVKGLKIGVFSTGNELLAGGSKQSDQTSEQTTFDSNGPMLVAAINNLGLEAELIGHVSDSLEVTKQFLLETAPEFDALLSTGGVSLGEEDHVRAALAEVGRIASWRVALKPGRPVTLGEVKDTPFVGLPGNPVAAFVTFLAVVVPLLRQLQGLSNIENAYVSAVPNFEIKKKLNRREFIRVIEDGIDDQGRILLRQHPKKGAGVLSSLTQSDGLLAIPEDLTLVSAGSQAFPYYRFDHIWRGI